MKRSKREDTRIGPGAAEEVMLRLFVTGSSQRAARAIDAVQSICKEYLGNCVQIEIIDVLEQPDRAESERILATPTLIRQSPGPPRRVIGDLTDASRIIQLLGLKARIQPGENE